MVTFKLGSGGKDVFVVSEDRIRVSSEFVDAAMRGPWQESQERSISLPCFDKRDFGIYLHWLLTGVIHSKQRTNDPAESSLIASYNELYRLPKLFELGHYLLDTSFRDALNDALMQCVSELQRFSWSFPATLGSMFYEKIPVGSPTRKLVAGLIAWTIQDYELQFLATKKDSTNSDFLMNLLLAMGGRYVSKPSDKSPLVGWQTSCEYHCHGDEKPCYRRKANT
jgi:hypothetical protein